ncbi:MAG: hydroxyglutarate oxidase [Candidatus Poribacteria bacterium]|nr:MAG: hydroxyglutarate oxidase [Candidatus Poribacteria bacterium]
MAKPRYDLAIVGGGIVGLATALALTEHYRLRLVLLEAEDRLASHQTGHNSGVIHSGLYYRPGSLKAHTCVTGREMLYRFCEKHDIPHERCGKVVVAVSKEELPRLDELERRGRANGLNGLRRLEGEAVRELEPHVRAQAALHVPETGIVDFAAVARKIAELAQERGAEIRTRSRLLAVQRRSHELALETTSGTVAATGLINCGGLYCDRIARLCGDRPPVRIVPFRGEYYYLRPERRSLVRNLIYPVPDPRFPFLGVHFTRTISGQVEAGPNAVLAFSRQGYRWGEVSLPDLGEYLTYRGFWRMAARYWRTGLVEMARSLSKRLFVSALQRLIPEVRPEDVCRGGSGVRAQALAPDGRLVDDFLLLERERAIHVLNAPSPAATASLRIGELIAERAGQHFDLTPIGSTPT